MHIRSLFLLVFAAASFLHGVEIKGLRLNSGIAQNNFPVVLLGESLKPIEIGFDVDSDEYPSLVIRFVYCDSDWQPTKNMTLANYHKLLAFNLKITDLPFATRGARYTFKESFPNEGYDVEFPYSGKMMFRIEDSFDPSKVYATGRFYVVETVTRLKLDVIKNQGSLSPGYSISDTRTSELKTNFILSDEFFPFQIQGVEFVKNRELTDAVTVKNNQNNNAGLSSWNGNRNFEFRALGVKPGNEYRKTDLRSVIRNQAEILKAGVDEIEYSRYDKRGSPDNDGDSELMPAKGEQADYVKVRFSIRPPEPVEKIVLVGSFTQWDTNEQYTLTNNNGVYSTIVELRRGYYEYKYVAFRKDERGNLQKDEVYLEGNFPDSKHEYSAFLMYREESMGGYDRIIGYTTIKK